jgi:hypothetical protein
VTSVKKAKKTAKTVVPEHDTPVHRFVAQIQDNTGIAYLTTREVAETLGVSTQWIRKIQRGTLLDVPSMAVQFGQMQVYLYSPADVDKIRNYLNDRQKVYSNPRNPGRGGVETWEDVVKRRDGATQDEDREVERERTGRAAGKRTRAAKSAPG